MQEQTLDFDLFVMDSEQGQEVCIAFCCTSKTQFGEWFDGLQSLLGRTVLSEESNKYFESLLRLETKMALFHLDSPPVTSSESSMPELPKNFNFFYSDSDFGN